MNELFLKNIAYTFKNDKLLALALTHSGGDMPDNERLEFLGDRVLGLVLAESLLEKFAEEAEGNIAKRLAWLASSEVLFKVAQNLGLPENIIFYKSDLPGHERKSVKVISDALEALIAALYLDGGFEVAKDFITRNWQSFLAQKELPYDAKSKLQEVSQEKFSKLPSYEVISKTGSDHQPHFVVQAKINEDLEALGEGDSKKSAEKMAAEKLLARINE